MKALSNWKNLAVLTAALALFAAGVAAGANAYNKPKSIIHVVSVKWKADATEAQKQAAIQGVEKMAAAIPGIKNIWLQNTRKQFWGETPETRYDAAWVIEFENREAERAYEKSPARTEWLEKVYNPIRQESRSNQFTNQ